MIFGWPLSFQQGDDLRAGAPLLASDGRARWYSVKRGVTLRASSCVVFLSINNKVLSYLSRVMHHPESYLKSHELCKQYALHLVEMRNSVNDRLAEPPG